MRFSCCQCHTFSPHTQLADLANPFTANLGRLFVFLLDGYGMAQDSGLAQQHQEIFWSLRCPTLDPKTGLHLFFWRWFFFHSVGDTSPSAPKHRLPVVYLPTVLQQKLRPVFLRGYDPFFLFFNPGSWTPTPGSSRRTIQLSPSSLSSFPLPSALFVQVVIMIAYPLLWAAGGRYTSHSFFRHQASRKTICRGQPAQRSLTQAVLQPSPNPWQVCNL